MQNDSRSFSWPWKWEEILDDLASSDRSKRESAVWHLGDLRDSRSVDVLASLLSDADPLIARTALSALADTGDRRAIQPALEMLNSPDRDWCLNAISSVNKFCISSQDVDAWAAMRAFLPHMLALLDHPDLYIREASLIAIKNLGDERVIPHVGRMVHDVARPVKTQALFALFALRRFGIEAVEGYVGEAKNDEDESTRGLAENLYNIFQMLKAKGEK